MLDCQYLIIGSGQTGLILAKELSNLGYQTILVEQDTIGGSYVNTLELPKLYLEKQAQEFATGLRLFKHNPETFTVLKKFRQKLETKIKQHVNSEIENLKKNFSEISTMRIIRGRAEFVSKSLVEVNSDQERHLINFQQALIAVGKNQMIRPTIPGIENVPFLFQHSIYLLNELPSRLAILGCNEQNLEVADLYANLGVKVDVFETNRTKDSIAKMDRTGFNFLIKQLVSKQVDFFFETKINTLEYTDGQVIIKDQTEKEHKYSHLYIDVAETFEDEYLNLGKIGLKFTKQGIVTNQNGRTVHGNIWAFGECSSVTNTMNKFSIIYDFIHKAKSKKPDSRKKINLLDVGNFIPDAEIRPNKTPVFKINVSDPVIGMGMTNLQASSQYGPFAKNEVISSRQMSGFIKLIYKENTGQILGICLAGEMAKQFENYSLLVMKNNVPYKDIRSFLKSYWGI